ncbi:MAG: hypothetical protein HY595_03795 [Candidatus Omnitrophica bacterium]|nr:hypothetical protein [Candidatus Omnitrophota bacterium]
MGSKKDEAFLAARGMLQGALTTDDSLKMRREERSREERDLRHLIRLVPYYPKKRSSPQTRTSKSSIPI